jgi:aryl-alcohol dehydrogenase (NADP+)
MPATAALRPLGSSGLDVHPICLGGNVFGWTADRDASFAILDAYVAAGGNFVDTADSYSSWAPGNRGGESERVIGAWLADRGRPDGLVVATKVGPGSEDLPQGLERDHVLRGAEASRRRLGVEAIDLYYAHRDYDHPPLEETLVALDDLVKAGAVRALGASNYATERLAHALDLQGERGLTPYTAVQPRLNLVDRDVDDAEADLCERRGLGLAVYSALASGFLSGKYRPGQPVPDSPRAGGIANGYLQDARAMRILAAADAVAGRQDATTAQVALAWALAQRAVTSVIVSATSTAQLAELMATTELDLGADDLAELDGAA